MEAPPISVILCANRLRDRAEMEEALVHELVHVYDVSRPHTSGVLSYLRHNETFVVDTQPCRKCFVSQYAVAGRDLTDCAELAFRYVCILFQFHLSSVNDRLTGCLTLSCPGLLRLSTLVDSEIRAAREAECHYTPQPCSWFKKHCVRDTATRSTSVSQAAVGCSHTSSVRCHKVHWSESGYA